MQTSFVKEYIKTMDTDLFDTFSDILTGSGSEPFEDDIEAQAADFALGHGLDPEEFHTGYLHYLAGIK